jgi:hypothetical protein
MKIDLTEWRQLSGLEESRLPWAYDETPASLGATRTVAAMYRAAPLSTPEFRPGDYITPLLRFAQDHAVTSALYQGEDFAVYRALVKTEDMKGARNPGEFIYTGARTPRVKIKNIADAEGQLLDAHRRPARYA